MPEEQHQSHVYSYFVDTVRYQTDQPTVTGALIKAKIPDFESSYCLFLEGQGDAPDQMIGEDTSVSMTKQHEPLRFYTVPPATFG